MATYTVTQFYRWHIRNYLAYPLYFKIGGKKEISISHYYFLSKTLKMLILYLSSLIVYYLFIVIIDINIL